MQRPHWLFSGAFFVFKKYPFDDFVNDEGNDKNTSTCKLHLRVTNILPPFNDKQQPDALVPFCEISDCLPPLGVSFPWTWDPRDQLWSHAGHTSVTQTLTKRHQSVESTETTLR